MGRTMDTKKGHYCFLCLEQQGSPQPPPPELEFGEEPGIATSSGGHHAPLDSLNSLFRCLKMGGRMTEKKKSTKPMSLGSPQPAQDLEEEGSSGSKVGADEAGAELCEDCAHLMKDFSKLYRQLEKMEMKVISLLALIHGKMLKAEKGPGAGKNPQKGTMLLLGSLGALRAETVRKCYLKLDTDLPRVPLRKLTRKQVLALKMTPATVELATRTRTFDSDNEGRRGPSDMDISVSAEPANMIIVEASEEAMGTIKLELDPAQKDRTQVEEDIKIESTSDWEVSSETEGRSEGDQGPECLISVGKTGRARCSLCSKLFRNKYILQTHYTNLHLNPPGVHAKNNKCPKCKKLFTDVGLYQHQRGTRCAPKSVKRHRCHQCGKIFIQLGNLQVHLKAVHSQVRNYPCQVCGKTFKTKGVLKSHHDRIHIKNGRQGRRAKEPLEHDRRLETGESF